MIAQTDSDGHFTLSKVTEGVHAIQAIQQKMGSSMRASSATVQVVAGKTANITIDIPIGGVSLTIDVRALPNNQVNAAQVFLFSGNVAASDGKQIMNLYFQGAAKRMKIWSGAPNPPPAFDELVPGAYSVCTIPITGDASDPIFRKRMQANIATLRVYCKPVVVEPSPASQAFVHEVPSMTPFPP
jgi:hypothetical protein